MFIVQQNNIGATASPKKNNFHHIFHDVINNQLNVIGSRLMITD